MTPHSFLQTRRRGQSLIEIVVAMGMVVFFGAAFVTLVSTNYGRLEQSRDQSQATYLAQEAITAVRAIGNTNFSKLIEGEELQFNGTKDGFLPGVERRGALPAAEFTRTISIERLKRVAAGDEIGQPARDNLEGIADPDGYYVKVQVAWQNDVKKGATAFYTIVTNWNKGGSIVFDTQNDFWGAASPDASTALFHDTSAVKDMYNGEVRLGQVGGLEEPTVVGLDPGVTLHAQGETHAMARYLDELYVLNENNLLIYSLAGVTSPKTVTLLRTITLTDVPLRAIAVDERHVFLGTTLDANEVIVYDRAALLATPTPTPRYEWNLAAGADSDGDVQVMTLDTVNDRLLVATTDGNVYLLNVSPGGIDDASPPRVMQQNIGSDIIHALATDGTFAYIGTSSNSIYSLYLKGGTPTVSGVISFNPSNVPVRALAVINNTLIVGRSEHPSEAELLAFTLTWDTTLERVTVTPAGSQKIRASIRAIQIQDGRIVVLPETNGTSNDDVKIFAENLTPVGNINIDDVNGCIAAVYEAGRAYVACQNAGSASAPSRLIVLEDAEGRTSYAMHATYTSPVRTVPPGTTLAKWGTLAFQESGQGFTEIRIRSGTGADSILKRPWLSTDPEQPWIPRIVTDDTAWHDISDLPPDPFVQIQVTFHASELCPLYLENVILTYE